MAIGDIIVGIDIGTSKVCCCLGQINKFNQVEILNSSAVNCDGIKKGKIVSTDAVARAIRFAVSDIEATQDFIIKSAYVNIIGKYVSILKTTCSVQLEDKYAGVSQRNIDTLIRSAGSMPVKEGYQIVDIVPARFTTDSRVTDDPIGIFTDTVGADFDIIIADKIAVKSIGMAMQKAGLLIDGIVINGYAMKEIVINENENKEGVLLLDISNGNIDIAIFKDNSLLYTDSIPVGGDTITNDISIGLEISYQEADKLKKQYGLAKVAFIDNDYSITLSTYNGQNPSKTVKCSELVEIIEARVEEIFSIIKQLIDENGLKNYVSSCVIAGQGFNSINKSEKVAEDILKVPVRFGISKTANLIKPDCVGSYGIVKHVANIKYSKNIGSKVQEDVEQSFLDNVVSSFKSLFGAKPKKIRK